MALDPNNIVGRGLKVAGSKMLEKATMSTKFVPPPEEANEDEAAEGSSCCALAAMLLDAALRFHFFHINVRSPQFVGLHEFYGDAYQALYGWFDRFAERGRAEGETAEPFETRIAAPTGDCLTGAQAVITLLQKEADAARDGEDTTTQAMIDELSEYLGKLSWQLDAMANP